MSEENTLTTRVESFIGIYENAFSKEFCEQSIKYFELQKQNGFFVDRTNEGSSRHKKDDYAVFVNPLQEKVSFNVGELCFKFNNILSSCYKNYQTVFSVLQEPDTATHGNNEIKIQRTPVGGGYHVWHYESADLPHADRIITWMVYLNDVEEGGETEFLYLAKRIKPKQGTLLIWPAGFTHTHRGNPPISNEKYILTGWLEF